VVPSKDNDLLQDRQKSANRSFWGLFFRIAVSGFFVWIILHELDIALMARAVRSIDSAFFFLSFLAFMILELPIALRVRALLRTTVLQPSLWRLVHVDIMSRFYAAFLPAGVGTNLFRWFRITENRSGRGQFLMVLAVEKILFLTVTLLASGLPLLWIQDGRLADFKRGFIPVFWFLAGLLFLLYLYLLVPAVQNASDRVVRPLRNGLPARVGNLWDKVVNAACIYRGQWKIMGLAFLFSLVLQMGLLLMFTLLFFALRVPLPVFDILWISSLVFLVQTLPISLAGIGVRESGFAYLVSLYDIPPENGVLIGVLFGLLFFMRSLVGIALYLAERRGKAT